MSAENVAIELREGTTEIASVQKTDAATNVYRGIHGLQFVAPTLREARNMAIAYATEEEDRWSEVILNLRALRAGDVQK